MFAGKHVTQSSPCGSNGKIDSKQENILRLGQINIPNPYVLTNIENEPESSPGKDIIHEKIHSKEHKHRVIKLKIMKSIVVTLKNVRIHIIERLYSNIKYYCNFF